MVQIEQSSILLDFQYYYYFFFLTFCSHQNNNNILCSIISGTKRIPGTQADRSAPRTVKTYQERLREMKQARAATQGPIRRYTGPIPGQWSSQPCL